MKKHLSLLLVPIYLVSCVSNPVAQSPRETPTVNLFTKTDDPAVENDYEFFKLSDCAEKNFDRKPSAENNCKKFYEKTSIAQSAQPKDLISQVSGKSRVIEQYGQTENMALWSLVLGAEKVAELARGSRTTRLHPVELIPDKSLKSISLAWRTLRDMPDTKFTLNSELLLDVNKLLMGDAETAVIQDLNSRVTVEAEKKSAVEKLRKSISTFFKADPGFRTKANRVEYENVKDDLFQVYKSNAEAVGGRLVESADSLPDQRVFTLELPRRDQVKAITTRILEEANSSMNALVSATYAEKIDFVAGLQLKLAVLNPLAKMNDITIQMYVNRVLIQLGLDPAVKVQIDPSMTKQQVAEIYRNGIASYLKLTVATFEVAEDKKDGTAVAKNEAVSITGRGAGLRVQITGKFAKKYPKAVSYMRTLNRVTPIDGRAFQLGKDRRTFVLKDDGFLYDGITPHTIREENGVVKLYPISDLVYRLIGLNGDFTGEIGAKREITAEQLTMLGDNLSTVENILQNRMKPEDVQVVYDKAAIEANVTGALYIYDWQIPILERASSIKEDPKENPYAVLIPGRGDPVSIANAGSYSFEKNFFKGFRGNKIGDLVGHYEQKDLDYNQLARQVQKNTTLSEAKKRQILKNITESRRKMHAAAREILRPFLTKYNSLNAAELANLRENSTFLLFEDFFRNFSKLSSTTYEQGVQRLGDDHVYVHRLQTAKLTNTLGFTAQNEMRNHPIVRVLTVNGLIVPQLREILTAMRSASEAASLEDGKIGNVIARKIGEIAKGNKVVEGMLATVVLRVYAKRAADIQSTAEFESLFMDHYLHAVNRGLKTGVSTTTDPTYLAMVKTYEQLSKIEIEADDGIAKVFKAVRKSKDPVADAKKWLADVAEKERTKKLPVEYYQLGWIGGFAKEFKVSVKEILEMSEAVKDVNDKFTNQDDGTIYVLRIPVEQLNANFASGFIQSYSGQFENTTNRGFGLVSSKWGVFARPIINRKYSGSEKFGVNLAELSEGGRAVYDMTMNNIESRPDFTPHLEYSSSSSVHQGIVSGLTSQNKMLFRKSIRGLATLKYDMQTIRSEQDWAGFKQLVEDVFNGSVKAIEAQTDGAVRKEMINGLASFLSEHGLQDNRVAGWAAELWDGIIPSKGKTTIPVGKDVVRKARSEAAAMKQVIGAPATDEPAA